MKISASFLGSKNIPKTLIALNITDVDYIHVDIMDGKYVKGKTMPLSELSLINNYTRKRLDIHLMVKSPLKLIDSLATLNVEYLTFHLDILDNIEDLIIKTKTYGIKVGLAINPDDDVTKIFPMLSKIDLVLIMGVKPGLPGQEFIKSTLTKINQVKDEIKRQRLNTLISIDGGVTLDNIKYLKDCDIIVSGTTITKESNYQEIITKLRNC